MQVAVFGLENPGLVGASSYEQAVEKIKNLQIEVDYIEASFPIPSTEKDQSDTWEIEQGIKSRVQCVMERYSKTRTQAIEHIRQVAEDEAAIKNPGSIPTVSEKPPLKIVSKEVSSSSGQVAMMTSQPAEAQPPGIGPGVTAVYPA
jgi:hypothetical protein